MPYKDKKKGIIMSLKDILSGHMRDPHGGVWVHKGWENIVIEAHGKIVEVWPDVRYIQIKEKFGGLRMYLDATPDDVRATVSGIIHDAEALADRTCQECGASGVCENDECGAQLARQRNIRGWYATLCNSCTNQAMKDRNAH